MSTASLTEQGSATMARITREAETQRMYAPERTIHTVAAGTDRTLCNRPTTGLHTLPTDPWARVGAEAGTKGMCLRCLSREMSA